MKRILIFLLVSFSLPSSAMGEKLIVHGGALNSDGCHNDNKNDSRHCHRSIKKGRITSTNENIIRIKSCYDGDTCTSTNGEKIRLACIDSPELRGANADPIQAKLSRDFLNSLVVGKDLEIRRITKDRYTRTVAELSLKGENIQQMMVKRGYAQIYSKYSFQCPWAR